MDAEASVSVDQAVEEDAGADGELVGEGEEEHESRMGVDEEQQRQQASSQQPPTPVWSAATRKRRLKQQNARRAAAAAVRRVPPRRPATPANLVLAIAATDLNGDCSYRPTKKDEELEELEALRKMLTGGTDAAGGATSGGGGGGGKGTAEGGSSMRRTRPLYGLDVRTAAAASWNSAAYKRAPYSLRGIRPMVGLSLNDPWGADIVSTCERLDLEPSSSYATSGLSRLDDGLYDSVASLHSRRARESLASQSTLSAALRSRKDWDGTPLRYVPAALKGLSPVTPEAWARDQHVHLTAARRRDRQRLSNEASRDELAKRSRLRRGLIKVAEEEADTDAPPPTEEAVPLHLMADGGRWAAGEQGSRSRSTATSGGYDYRSRRTAVDFGQVGAAAMGRV